MAVVERFGFIGSSYATIPANVTAPHAHPALFTDINTRRLQRRCSQPPLRGAIACPIANPTEASLAIR
ncbi:hypothetical protein B7760_06017 (plasmid) [Burkholderia glumae]|nr:hypothetical protein B7760_06017 [Burkholderia glumae]QKM57518.1 hypothetical protein CG017_05597 [Burkholderia glumae]QTP37195.1 hypothetical protein B7759_05837 [Burkholderia glumae]